MINKLISGVIEHFSTEIQNNSKLDQIIKQVLSILYSKFQIYINALISLYFILLFICLLILILILFKN
jgi:hypothetical protein